MRSRWSIAFGTTGPAVAALVTVGACGGEVGTRAASTAGCTSDTQCAAQAPPTTPPNCAVAACDTIHGVCVFSAPDDDGDGYTASTCVSTNGVSVANTGDCDDHDPNLYPGHATTCMPAYDGGDGVGACTAGAVSCNADGTKSACTGTCTLCAPLGLGCDGVQPAQCNASGTAWTPVGRACADGEACIGGACVEACTPRGATRCSGAAMETCGATGVWSAPQACTAGPNPSCSEGRCDYNLTATAAGFVAVDATHVFWSDGAEIFAAPIGGGAASTLATGQVAVAGLAADGTSVYWTDVTAGTVMKVSLSGGAPTTLVSGQHSPDAIAVDAASVYWTTYIPGGAIAKVPVGGGAVTTLAAGQPYAGAIAIDSASAYWTTVDPGVVAKVSLDGGAITTIASGQDIPSGIAVDATSVYWATNADYGTITKAPINGGPATILASGLPFPQRLAVDSTNVYWADLQDAAILRVPLGGGGTVTFASGLRGTDPTNPNLGPVAIALNAATVFWTVNSPGGGLMWGAK
jgi:hypothetical protein